MMGGMILRTMPVRSKSWETFERHRLTETAGGMCLDRFNEANCE